MSDSDGLDCPLLAEEGSDQAVPDRGCRLSPSWILEVLGGMGFVLRDISSAEANWSGNSPPFSTGRHLIMAPGCGAPP